VRYEANAACTSVCALYHSYYIRPYNAASLTTGARHGWRRWQAAISRTDPHVLLQSVGNIQPVLPGYGVFGPTLLTGGCGVNWGASHIQGLSISDPNNLLHMMAETRVVSTYGQNYKYLTRRAPLDLFGLPPAMGAVAGGAASFALAFLARGPGAAGGRGAPPPPYNAASITQPPSWSLTLAKNPFRATT
jgi:hypothetical protein